MNTLAAVKQRLLERADDMDERAVVLRAAGRSIAALAHNDFAREMRRLAGEIEV